MNTTIRFDKSRSSTSLNAMLFGVAACLALAALSAARADAAPAAQIVKLERVVVEGKRQQPQQVQIVQLPRVVIEGYSSGRVLQLAAARQACPAQSVC